MYYYYVYAYKGDMIRKEFVAFTHKQDIDEVFDDMKKLDYDCIVIDEITRKQYEDQHDPYSILDT